MRRTDVLVLAFLIILVPTVHAQTALHRLAVQSTFIFVGTATGSSTEDGARRVTVDRVLRASRFFVDNPPKEVDVVVGRRLEKGEQALFFTRGRTLGETVVVEELARLGDTDVTDLAPLLERESLAMDEASLLTRLREAELVVVARVATVRPSSQRGRIRLTEHHPQWRDAVLVIREALKGERSGRLTILFPGSVDVMWRDAPRLSPGQEAIFLLSPAPAEFTDRRALAVVQPLDVQPLSELERIRTLLRRLQ